MGYNGSESGDFALRWALDEGIRRGLPVRVLHIVEWPVIDTAIAAAESGSTATVSIVEGPIVGTLCGLSSEASMVVLGRAAGADSPAQ